MGATHKKDVGLFARLTQPLQTALPGLWGQTSLEQTDFSLPGLGAQDPTGSPSESALLVAAASSAPGTFFIPTFLPPSAPECPEMLILYFMQELKSMQERLIKTTDREPLTTLPPNPHPSLTCAAVVLTGVLASQLLEQRNILFFPPKDQSSISSLGIAS